MANDLTFILRAKNQARGAAKQFNDDLKKAGHTTDSIRDSAKKARDEFGRFKKSGKEVGDEFEKAGSKVTKTRREVDLLRSAGTKAARAIGAAIAATIATVGIGRVFGDAITVARDFEKALSDVAAVGNFTQKQMAAVEAQARDLGAATQFSAKEAAAGIEFLVRAGFDAGQALEAIPTALKLAQAGNIDLARSADIASNILSAARLDVSEFERVGNELAVTAASANVNVEQLGASFRFFGPSVGQFGIATSEAAAAIGILGNNGIQGALAGSTLRAIFTRLVKPTKQASDALATYNLTIADVSPETNTLSQIIETLAEANISAADAVTIFGAEAQGAINILTTSRREYEKLRDTIKDSEGALDALAQVMGDNLNGAVKEFRSAVEELYISLVNNEALTNFVQFLTAIIRALTPAREGFRGLADATRDTAAFMEQVKQRAQELEERMARFQEIANNLVTTVKDLLSAVALAAGFQALVTAFGALTGVATGTAAGLGLVSTAIGFLVRVLTGPVGIIFAVISAIRALMGVQFQWQGTTISVGQVVQTVWGNIRTFIGGAIDFVKTKLAEYGPAITAAFNAAKGAVMAYINFMKAFWNTIIGGFVGLVRSIGTILSNLPAVIQGAFAGALNGAITIVERALNRILDGFRNFLLAIDAAVGLVGGSSDLASSIGTVELGGLKFDTSQIQNVGSEIAAGFSDAMSTDYVQAAVNGARDVATAVFEGAIAPTLDKTAQTVRIAQEDAAMAQSVLQPAGSSGTIDPTTPVTPGSGTTPGSGSSGSGGGGGGGGSNPQADKLKQQAEARKQLNEAIQQTIQGYRDETELLGLYGEELAFAQDLQALSNQARQAGIELTAEQIELLKQEKEALLEARRAADTFTNGLKAGLAEINDNLQTNVGFVRDFTVQAFNGMTNAIVDFVTTGKADFKGLLVDLLKSISQFLAERLVANFLNAFGAGLGSGIGSGGGLFGRAASVGLADGGWVTGRGGPRQDNQMRFLSVGEHVTNAREASRYAPLLEAINAGNAEAMLATMMNRDAAMQRRDASFDSNPIRQLQEIDTSPRGGSFNPTINFNFPNGDTDSFRRSEGQVRARMQRLMQDASERNN